MPQSEANLQFICHGGHRVAVLSGNPRAAGMPLIFLHGIAGSVHFWPALLPHSVAHGRRWYSIGLPGHWPGAVWPGRLWQTNDCGHVSPACFSELLGAVIRDLDLRQPAALIGYSTGGFAALTLAAQAPELVAGVVSVSGFSVGHWHGALGRLQSLARCGQNGHRWFARLWSLMTANPAIFRRCLLTTAAKHDPSAACGGKALLDLVAHDARQQDPAVQADLFANIKRFDIRPLLADIRVPTLIAGGNCDPVISYDHTCELASSIRAAELITFRGVGHLFFVECPDVFRQMLEDWIEQHGTLRQWRRAA